MRVSRPDSNSNSIGHVDLGHDLFPYKFVTQMSDRDLLGHWFARLLIKANEAGRKGILIQSVDVLFEDELMTLMISKLPREDEDVKDEL